MKAVVLAAGVGSRLDPLTTQLPKPLVPLANRPVLEHILQLLQKHGIKDVYSNLYHLADSMIDYYESAKFSGLSIRYEIEKELSGDAGGVRLFREHLKDDTFVVMSGDLLTDANIAKLVAEHKRKKALASVALKKVDDVSQFGVAVVNEEGFITGFQEKPKPSEALSHLASTAIYIFEPEVFAHIPQTGSYGIGRELFPSLVKKGAPVLGIEITDYWSDVGTINQYRASNFDALTGRVEVQLPGRKASFGWVDDNSSVSENCQISGNLMVGKNSKVGSGVQIEGNVIVGDNCVIDSNAYIKDSIVWSGASIKSGASLTDSIVGKDCTVSAQLCLTQDILMAAI